MGGSYAEPHGTAQFDQEIEEDDPEDIKLKRLENEIDDFDPTEVQSKQFSVKKMREKNKVKEQIRAAGQQTRTTNQYQKLVNAHLKDRVSKINKIKIAKEQFDRDIESLNNENFSSYEKLQQTNVSELNTDSMEELLFSITINYDVTQSRLEYFRNRVIEAENELLEQQRNIKKIKEEIQKKKLKEETSEQMDNAIKEEVRSLGEKYSVSELKKALGVLKDIKS